MDEKPESVVGEAHERIVLIQFLKPYRKRFWFVSSIGNFSGED